MSNRPAFNIPSQPKEIKHKHNILCAKQIQKKIIQAEEDEVHDTKVEGFVVRDLTLSAALLLHYQVHARIWRHLQLHRCTIQIIVQLRYVQLFV